MKTLKKLGDTLNTGDEKGIIIAVAMALVVISAVVAGYYLLFRGAPEGYTTIYLLDAQGQAVNYPDTMVVNQDYTFNVWVENHMGQSLNFELQLKIANETIPLFPAEITPVNTYAKTLANGEKWETQAAVKVNETGSHSIIFELWKRDEAGEFSFTGNAVILNVEVVSQP